MRLSRRDVMLTGAALALCPGAVAAQAARATRELALYRGGVHIGTQSLAVRRDGEEVGVDIALDIAVRMFGLTVYRHTVEARELWRSGRLVSAEAATNANGRRTSMRAGRDGDAVAVDGSAFTGRVGGNPATTSYWSPAFLSRGVWIDLADGRPRRVTARNLGVERFPTLSGAVEAARWRIGGEVDPVDLFFDAGGEWVGNEFEAEGEIARFVVAGQGASLTALWVDG
jgi:hypothetical protein